MRHRHQGGKEGEGGEPAAAVRPDKFTFIGMCSNEQYIKCLIFRYLFLCPKAANE